MIEFTEAFTWLNEFAPSNLTLPATIFRDQILEKIKDQKYMHAYQVLEYLKNYNSSRSDPLERAEIWVECGAAFYEMGNPFEAVSSLKQAVEKYAPSSHKLAVTRWLLGIVQWCVDAERMQALISWQKAIEEFQNLKKQADYDNDCARKELYELRILRLIEDLKCQIADFRNPCVERAAKRKQEPALPPRDAGGEPPAAPSEEPYISGTPSPGAGQGNAEQPTYEDLLLLVGRDFDTADRLIEGEHRRFPKESRQQNITRAVIKLLRDRQ